MDDIESDLDGGICMGQVCNFEQPQIPPTPQEALVTAPNVPLLNWRRLHPMTILQGGSPVLLLTDQNRYRAIRSRTL